MALSLGKITIIVGAGIATTVLAQEGHISFVSDFLSGACKILIKQIANGDAKPSKSKPKNDALMAQVNSLRQELQLLASGRPVTIITSSGSGPRRYGVVIVIIVVGYGYIRWKGWKLPDMMFATKRGLSDACNTVAKQLENVYTSISATKQHLSERIDRVDINLDECAGHLSTTKNEVSELSGEMKSIGDDVQSVHGLVRTLETKIHRIEAKQDSTNDGVRRLVVYARNLENVKAAERIEGSNLSRPALEMAPLTPPSRVGSLPPLPASESLSPTSSSGFGKVRRPLQSAVSDSGLKELYGISETSSSSSQVSVEVISSPEISTNNSSTTTPTASTSTTTTPSLFSRQLGMGASFLTRARSALQSAK
ncbi:uncharacterized protein LOC124920753 [Impatiens glandulifera]|uniref:uncharacterized protein LOC124920753 n=1 Tax=Impatiens glandulifera TaxID=253017 RepID=UPI001FB09D49|nr:uncharacterized protein LOC124920753 [Impatiens glandulifera]